MEFVSRWAGKAPVIAIAATREAAGEVALAACGDALVGVQRAAFRDLVLELSAAAMNRSAIVPVSRVVREALAARVAAEALRAGRLTYFAPVAGFPGFPRALAETFEEVRLNRTTPEQPDLALLLRAYESELAGRGFADHAARVAMALSSIADRFRDTVVVALDLALRTRSESELLEAILASSRQRLVLSIGDTSGGGLTGLSLGGLRERDGSFEIFSTSGEALECVEIARRILRAAIPFDETAILLRSPERYQPLIMEALRRAGIPAHCTRGARRPDAAGRALLALLRCAEERLSASRFAEYLSLGQMPDEEEPRTPVAWERLLVDAAVIGGPERWAARLAGLREELYRRCRLEEDEDERARIERRIASLDNLRDFALPIVERLAALPGRATWGDWLDALNALSETTIRDPERIAEFLEELEPLSDIGPVGLSEVLLVIGPRLNTLASTPKDSRFGKVWISGIAEARGLAFRQVFAPGVNEGLFPRPPSEDLLGVRRDEEDAELLRIAAACASERLVLSFSRLDLLTGRERVPSFYAFVAHRAAGGGEMGVREFEDQARSRTGTRIGWPAPADPTDAIDDAEFDLATLAPLAKGSGQYLKSLPGRAVASLRARWTRWHKTWKPADGLYVEEIGTADLKPYLLSARPWSPSALQQYARCPYRFALHGIFGLRPAERPSGIQRMEPVTRGQIYHEVQFELLRALEARGMLPVTAANLAGALEILAAVMENVAAREQAELAPAIPQIWRAEVQSLHTDLRGWLQQNAALEADWTPQFYELSFGLADPAGRDPRSRKEPVRIDNQILLRGSIDLVERHRTGVLRVVDHKTGRMPDPRPEVVGQGEVLQPMLYALAAGQMLNEEISSGRLYYSTIAQNYAVVDVPVNEWNRRRTARALHIIDGAVRDGFLPAAPRRNGCKGCEYLPVCGPYEEERVHAKSQAELKELKELRGLR
ncbi:MAG TPA: PD-(D/E)XK nuclease family protein [Candidatus Acidoferrales bacterium]|nr:PD-(D/E)XK nuclease family protein [Candidatus Acidoferrales bacterium]